MLDAPARAWRRLRALLSWRQHNADLAEEIALHEELKRDEFAAQGMTPREAAEAARRAMGNVTSVRESSRGVWLFTWLASVGQDLAYGARALRRNPTFSLVAILGLTGGLGFSAAAFSGFNAFALRGWEVREPERMVSLFAQVPDNAVNRGGAGFSLDELAMLSQQSRTLDGVFTQLRARPDGTGAITAASVSANYFQVLGIGMVRGRGFSPDEDRLGSPQQVIVVGHHYWTTTLRSRADVLGSTVRVSGVPFTVIGVASPGFVGTDVFGVDAWVPTAAFSTIRPRDERSSGSLALGSECCVPLAARLAPGVSHEQAATEITTLLHRYRRPGIDTLQRVASVLPFTLVGMAGPDGKREVGSVFLLIAGGVAAVLLLACANVANLLLARATARQREIGIRLALGASRARIVRQLMTESLMLALLAGIPALLLARWVPVVLLDRLVAQAHTLKFTTDRNVLFFTLGLSVLCCLVFGLTPALHASRPLALQRARLPLRSVFLSSQVTFCVVLLVAAALFVRSASIGRNVELGFATEDVTELRVVLPATDSAGPRSRRLAVELPELARSLGLRAVAYSSNAPFNMDALDIRLPGATEDRRTRFQNASPEYFAVLDIPLLAGRTLASGAAGERELVVNEPLAELLGGVNRAVGSTVTFGGEPQTVVGVSKASRDMSIRGDVAPGFYRAFLWIDAPRIIVRGDARDAQRFARAITAQDPSLLVAMKPYSYHVEERFRTSDFAASISAALGMLALALASVGLFGVLSYWVQQRQQDISVRMALGASPLDVMRLVLRTSARAVGWGLLVGVAGAAGVAQLLRSSLMGLSPLDPIAFAGALGVLVLCAMVATLFPVRRAVRIDPIHALRAE